MSDTNERGLARRQLVIVGIDFSADSNERMVAECIDAWGIAGLLEDVYLLDLSTETATAQDFEIAVQFGCAQPGSDDVIALEKVLGTHIWAEIIVISIRLAPISRIVSLRIEQEDKLKKHIERAFPADGGCKTAFFTMSWLNDEDFSESAFPQSYTSNLIHDRSIYVGDDLAVAPFDERSRHLSLAFTSLISAGGFVGQASSSLIGLVESDGRMALDRVVRPIRAIARGADGGWLFRDALRQAMSRESFIMPGSIVNAVPDGGSPIVVDNLVKESAEMCNFRYHPHESVTGKAKRMGFFRALVYFLKTIPRYVPSSARRIAAEKIAQFSQPMVDALQSVYGSNSVVVIRGTDESLSMGFGDDTTRLLQYLAQHKNELGLEPAREPKIWKDLACVVMGSLDGSDLPGEITCLSKGNRLIFDDPAIVGPSPGVSIFRLTKPELEILGVDKSESFREPDVLFVQTIDSFRARCSKAKLNLIFGSPETKEETRDGSADLKATQIRSRLLGGKVPSIPDFADGASRRNDSTTSRDVRKIAEDFEKWLPIAQERSRASFLAKLANLLEQEADRASADIKLEELKKRLDDMLLIKNNKKKRLGLVAGFGVGSLFGVIALSQLKWVSLALLPLGFIWLVIWLFSSALALAIMVFKRAVQDYREDHGRASESSLQFLFESTTQALREHIRLRSLQMQLLAWSRILREIIHNPYGTQLDDSEAAGDLSNLPHSRQFSIARVEPNLEQMQFLQNSIRRMLLVRGYLSTVFEGVLGVWRERYKKFELGLSNQDPYADLEQTWGKAIAQAADGQHVYFPLQDLFENLVHRDLREDAARYLQAEIGNRFSDYQIRDVFGKITDVDSDHQALRDFAPEDYLFEYLGKSGAIPRALRQDFDINLFNMTSARAVQLRMGNIDQDKSTHWNPSSRTLRDFNLRRNRRFIMLTHMVTLGELASPSDLSGYKAKSQAIRDDSKIWRPKE